MPKVRFIRICDAGDYQTAYNDYKDSETHSHHTDIVSYDTFIAELKKSYGNSNITQIARLKETDTGIFYDNKYC